MVPIHKVGVRPRKPGVKIWDAVRAVINATMIKRWDGIGAS